MLETTIRARNQMTLPPECMSELGLSVNDKLRVTLFNGGVLLTPNKSKADAVDSLLAFEGACRGAWGSTPEAVEHAVAEARQAWVR